MHVLIVEDNEFNAFCLRRLLESVMTTSSSVTVANNSQAALSLIYNTLPDLVIIDGALGAPEKGAYCNGPELANILLYKYPELPVIAWSDSETMRQEFSDVFAHYDRPINKYNYWAKAVSLEVIHSAWAYYFGGFINEHNSVYVHNGARYY